MSSRLYDGDPAKEAENLRRHGYDFDDGYRVLIQDPLGVMTWMDQRQDYSEDRWNTIGFLPDQQHILLHVTWTEHGDRLRIISVRNATTAERRRHANRHHRPR